MERATLVLNDMAWALDNLTAEMRMARKWGHTEELRAMVDLGIVIGHDLEALIGGSSASEMGAAIVPSEDAPKSFKECIEWIRSVVRAYKAKQDQHLEAMVSGSQGQKAVEKTAMKRLQQLTNLQVRNRKKKCRKMFPGKWSESDDEEFDSYIEIL